MQNEIIRKERDQLSSKLRAFSNLLFQELAMVS